MFLMFRFLFVVVFAYGICNFGAVLHGVCAGLVLPRSCLHVSAGWISTCGLIGRLFLGKDCKECVDWSVILHFLPS